MPFAPRPSISFPAFQTPAGLQPQADREHRSDYAETQGQTRELSRRTDGYWIDLPYSPGRFTTDGTAIWAVQKNGVLVARYKLIGSALHLSFKVEGTLNLPAQILRIQFPERLKARHAGDILAFASTGPSVITLFGDVVAGNRWINLYRSDFSLWVAGANQVTGQIVIEVEEV